MPEWSIGAVSKTVVRSAYRGFESLSLRKTQKSTLVVLFCVLQGDERLRSHTGFVIDAVAFAAQRRKNPSLSAILLDYQ